MHLLQYATLYASMLLLLELHAQSGDAGHAGGSSNEIAEHMRALGLQKEAARACNYREKLLKRLQVVIANWPKEDPVALVQAIR
jgi:hypothetical protein